MGILEQTRIESSLPPAGPPTFFICYRREDTEDFAARLNDKLETHFRGRARIFWDHGDIEYGDAFPEKIDQALKASRALVAVIGSRWAEIRDKRTGERRLESEKDFVRREIASALAAKLPVIPVLVKDAEMPGEDLLPDDLKPLAARNALIFGSTRNFDRDVKDLIGALEQKLPRKPPGGEHQIFRLLEEYGSKDTDPVGGGGDISTAAAAAALFIFFFILIVGLLSM
jgi:hypothetical protein